MAEQSYWWTTSSSPSGDQQASYSQADLARVVEALGGEGVIPGHYLGELRGSVTGANTVEIEGGMAIVDGRPYRNTSAETVNIPSASGSGNTRIDRIVLRADWASFTVRITRIEGTDAASPSAPAMTQTRDTTYDLPLYQATVDTSGAVTLEDETEWASGQVDDVTLALVEGVLQIKDGGVDTDQLKDAAVTPDKLDDLAVTAGKIDTGGVSTTDELADDIVDDSKVGDRVPQFYRRQGGSANSWDTPGDTTRTPGPVRMQAGSVDIDPLTPGASKNEFIDFPSHFEYTPLVFLSAFADETAAEYVVSAVDEEGFTLYVRNGSSISIKMTIYWLAIGPE